jgi:hypothetical protein
VWKLTGIENAARNTATIPSRATVRYPAQRDLAGSRTRCPCRGLARVCAADETVDDQPIPRLGQRSHERLAVLTHRFVLTPMCGVDARVTARASSSVLGGRIEREQSQRQSSIGSSSATAGEGTKSETLVIVPRA